jgi:DNA-binding FadR family transcriptional regulator
MASDFGVSRATLREAVKILRAQGVVRTSRGAKGGHFMVRPETDALAQSVGDTYGLWFDAGHVSIAEVDEAREVVERACVRLAAVRRTPQALVAMAAVLEAALNPALSMHDFLDLDIAFHREIARAAGNRLLELPLTAIHIVRPRTNKLLRHHPRAAVTSQHRAVYDAIVAGDADGSEQALMTHIEYLAHERTAALALRQTPAREIPVTSITDTEEAPSAEIDRGILGLNHPS